MSNEYYILLISAICLSFLFGVHFAKKISKAIAFAKKIIKSKETKAQLSPVIVSKEEIKDINHTLSIGITTFPARFEVLSKQVQTIREIDNDVDILLAVNSFYGKPLEKEYTQCILKLCQSYHVYPIFFPRFSGLAKMWNTLIRHIATTHVLLLNDDLEIDNHLIFGEIRNHIQNKDFFLINNSFSHFVISLKEAIAMNFFSERYIAFGEEDGDFFWRYYERHKKSPENVLINGITNYSLNSTSYDSGIDIKKDLYGGNKPTINTEITKYIYEYDPNGIKGMYDKTYKRRIIEPIQYPLEAFVIENWDNIRNFKYIKW